jgi:hypothetical protein
MYPVDPTQLAKEFAGVQWPPKESMSQIRPFTSPMKAAI